MDDDLIITLADVRRCGYCRSGSAEFAEQNGIDWPRFVATGLTVAELRLAVPEAILAQIIAFKKDQ